MKVIDIINTAVQNKITRFAFELLPPLKGETMNSIFDTIDKLIEFSQSHINVTFHREDIKIIERENGIIERHITRRRPGTIGISSAIAARYGVEVVPHLICGGQNRFETEDALIEMNFLGLHNILALRGDSAKGENHFLPREDGYAHAAELVGQICDMNHGKYIDGEINNCHATDFCIGVAGYPEKHFESPDAKTDIRFLKAKVDAGAHYIVTQMFFDNNKFFKFVEDCRSAGINVPIIPGLKPFSSLRQLEVLPNIFHVELPEDLVNAARKCKSDEDVKTVGVEWAIAQCNELKKAGIPVIHFYTMGRPDSMVRICRELF
jgi:methylenetetrahydrofolate reductase (NADPH)